MDIIEQPKLAFRGVNIIKVDFETIGSKKENTKIDVKCYPKVCYPKNNPNLFHIIMDVILAADEFFEIKILAIGTFEVNTELTADVRTKIVNANAPAIMFPYIRSFITTFTANLGDAIGALTIPPKFFKGDIEEVESDSIK